jgi:cytochrome b pre-mRNA-processing protein 3
MAFADFFRRSNPHEDAAATLYATVVEKARDPMFYTDLAVPDTINGRFDMVVIHAPGQRRRIRVAPGPEGQSLSSDAAR